MRESASVREIGAVCKLLEESGVQPHVARTTGRTHIGFLAPRDANLQEQLEVLDGVVRIFPSQHPFHLASRDFHPDDSVFQVGGVPLGGRRVVMMAGPCAVESQAQLGAVAEVLQRAGVPFMRGGAFKPRTSPYSFQGMGEQGLELLAQVRARTGLLIVTEVMSPQDVPLVARYADVAQVGSRSMQNFALLQELGRHRIPVLLKRGMMNSLEELLMSAEYLLASGNDQVMLCERGIRTFEKMTRNTLDISAVPVLKRLSHLPVVVDPSHAAGDRDLVPALTLAAVAAGADGILLETHPDPERSVSDAAQALPLPAFERLVAQAREVARAIGRDL